MWNLIDRKSSVTALYKESLPDFQKVTIQDVIIIPGEDIELDIRVDTNELPIQLPQKWIAQKVNTIQFVISCICVSFRQFSINEDFITDLKISIDREGGNKILTIWKNNGEIGLQVETSWISIKSLSGYCNTSIRSDLQ